MAEGYRQYHMDALHDAYMAVTEDGMKIKAAARRYGVPAQTLHDRVSGKVHIDVMKSGPAPMFSQEQEERLVSHIQYMAERGYGYSKAEVRNLASDYAHTLSLRSADQILSSNWFSCFMNRWPQLKLSKARAMEIYRAKASNLSNIERYFAELRKCLEDNNLLDKPQSIFNIDEKGLTVHYNPPKLVVKRGKPVIGVTPPRSATTTLIGCGSALGMQIPPFFVFKGTRFHAAYIENATPGAAGTVSPTSWSNAVIFSTYLKEHFLKFIPRPDPRSPILVLYDGHKTHVTIDIIEWARENNIILFVLPAHTSHFLQPFDLACFGALEKVFTTLKHGYIRNHPAASLANTEISEFGSIAYQEGLKPQNLTAGFRKAGIFPFSGLDAIDPAIFVLGEVYQKPTQEEHPNEANDPEDIFTAREQRSAEAQQQETKKRRVLGSIVGGKNITDDLVAQKVKEHINATNSAKTAATTKQTRAVAGPSAMDSQTVCCVCRDEFPPHADSSVTDFAWGGCDLCTHWVHLSWCVEQDYIANTTYKCPCHMNDEE